MIIRSKEKSTINGETKPMYVLDTDALTVTVNDLDFYPMELVTSFSSDQIKYHLHYAAEYHPDGLRRLVNSGEILNYLLDLEIAVEEALERQVNKWKAKDQEYLNAVAAGDMNKANGLENMLSLCAREPIFAAMVYV